MERAIITIVREDGVTELWIVVAVPGGAELHQWWAEDGIEIDPINSHLTTLSDHLYELLKEPS
jgi:hypothetical protein